jgi:hypothetical protein
MNIELMSEPTQATILPDKDPHEKGWALLSKKAAVASAIIAALALCVSVWTVLKKVESTSRQKQAATTTQRNVFQFNAIVPGTGNIVGHGNTQAILNTLEMALG